RIWLVSVVPCRLISSAPNTSTGTASSSAAAWRARDPTVTSTGASAIGWNATDLVAPLLVGGGAHPDRVDAHARAREWRALGVRDPSADSSTLGIEPVRQCHQQGRCAQHGERKALYHDASSSRATEFTTGTARALHMLPPQSRPRKKEGG